MRFRGAITALAAAFTSGGAQAALPSGHFGWMADLSGSCWRATYPDGKTTDTQCYSSQYDRYLRGTIDIRAGGAEATAYRGDSVFVWDPQTSQMRFHYWSSEGNNGVSQGSFEGESIVFANAPSTDRTKPARRSVWTRLSTDSFRVTLQERDGDAWRDGIAITYARQPLVDEHGASTDCSASEFRALDYLLGEWDVVETKTGAHFLDNRAELANDGCAVHEKLRTRDNVSSSALNFYSKADRRWYAYFHSPTQHAVLEGGLLPDGRHQLETRVVLPGEQEKTLVRQITSRDAKGRPHQLGLAVAADGSTRVLWDLTFCSLAPGADRSAPCDKAGSSNGTAAGR